MRWREWVNRLADRVGRKGAILATLGICWIAVGVNELAPATPGGSAVYMPPHAWLPSWLRVALWMVTGVTMIATAWRKSTQPAGWGAAVISPVMHAASYTWPVLMALIPGDPPGYWAYLPDAVAWVCVSVVLMWLASWPTMPHPPRTQKRGD